MEQILPETVALLTRLGGFGSAVAVFKDASIGRWLSRAAASTAWAAATWQEARGVNLSDDA